MAKGEPADGRHRPEQEAPSHPLPHDGEPRTDPRCLLGVLDGSAAGDLWCHPADSGFVFALSHTINDLVNGNIAYTITHFWNVFLIGTICGIAYILTRNVIYPILIHSVVNLLSFGGNFVIIMENDILLVNYRILFNVITIISIG